MPDDLAGLRAPLSLRDYLGVLWRRSWIIIAVAAIVFGVGLYRSERQTKVYEAQGQLELTNAASSGSTSSASDLDTQVSVIESPAVHDAAAHKAPGIGKVSASQAGLGNIINVSATDADAVAATRTVNATINAYLAYTQAQANSQTSAAAAAIQVRLNSLQAQITAANTPVPPVNSARAQLVSQLIVQQSALQQRLDGLTVDAAGAGTAVNVVARPTVPTTPIRPNPRTDGLLALGGGLLLGLVIALFVEYLARSGETADEQRRAASRAVAVTPARAPMPAPLPGPAPLAPPVTVEAPAPAPVPPPPPAMAPAPLPAPVEPHAESAHHSTGDVSLMGVIPSGQTTATEVVSISAPDSTAAQSYRSLRDAASFIGLERGRCFLVTSVSDREGKTETVANLAVLLAVAGQRVVVVDCDVRKPRVHELFHLGNDIGLTSVMDGAPLGQAVMCVPAYEHLYVLTSGPACADTDAMLRSDRCRELIDSLLVGGTLVLVEAPPVLGAPDALTLAETASVDGVILLASAKAEARNMLREALDTLHRSGDAPIGVVLTDTPDGGGEPQAVRTVRRSSARPRRHTSDSNGGTDTVDVLIRQLGHDDADTRDDADALVSANGGSNGDSNNGSNGGSHGRAWDSVESVWP